MKIIDFRARPNTIEYMKMFAAPASDKTWERFGYPKPSVSSLAEFVANLEKNDITKAVFTGRQSFVSLPNDYVADCVSQYPEKIIGFSGINPTTGAAAIRELERSVHHLGLQGLAIDAIDSPVKRNVRSFDDEQLMYPIYEKATELAIPVVFTMGPLVGCYGDPWSVDRVAADFPKLTIICSHGCWPQVTELISLAYRRDNVYLEASIYEFLPGAEPFIDAANTIIQDQVIYASAFPFNPLEIVKSFMKLPFSPEALEKVMYKNAARILKID